MKWTMDPVLANLQPALSPEDHALLKTLVAALSDKAKLPELDQFSLWRDAPPQPLD